MVGFGGPGLSRLPCGGLGYLLSMALRAPVQTQAKGFEGGRAQATPPLSGAEAVRPHRRAPGRPLLPGHHPLPLDTLSSVREVSDPSEIQATSNLPS